jgi:hypothetical protein
MKYYPLYYGTIKNDRSPSENGIVFPVGIEPTSQNRPDSYRDEILSIVLPNRQTWCN